MLGIAAVVISQGIQNIFDMGALFGWAWTLGFFTFVMCIRWLYRLGVQE